MLPQVTHKEFLGKNWDSIKPRKIDKPIDGTTYQFMKISNWSTIGNYCTVIGCIVGNGVAMGNNSNIYGCAMIGDHAVIGKYSKLTDMHIGRKARIGDRCEIYDCALIGDDATFGNGCNIGDMVVIGKNARFGECTVIRDDCELGVGHEFAHDCKKGAYNTAIPKSFRPLSEESILLNQRYKISITE
jgi:UDP-3-O-[3-hydroxymyristoyl] glucosamine N-acyltransferase